MAGLVPHIAGAYLSQFRSAQYKEAILPQQKAVHTAGNAGHWWKPGNNYPMVNFDAATFRAKLRYVIGWNLDCSRHRNRGD